MGWQYTPLVVPLAVATVVLTLVAGFITRQRRRETARRVRGARTVTAIILAAAFWTTTYGVELLRTDYGSALLLNKLQYLALAFLPLALFTYVYRNVLGHEPLDDRIRVALWGVPVVTVLLVFTNELHHLVWPATEMARVGTIWVLVNDHGPWYFVFITYSYVLIVGLLVLLGGEVARTEGTYRRQALMLLVGTACPAVAGVLYVLDLNPARPFNIAVFGFVPTSLALGWSVVHHQLFTLVPVARDRAVEQMREGILVVDERRQIVDSNPSAERLLGLSADDAVGRPVESFVEPALVEAMETDGTHTVETDGRYLELGVSPLSDNQNTRIGRLVLLRDVSPRVERNRQLERQNERLDEFASVVSHDLRNPLNVASGYLDLARETGDSEHFDRTADAHRRMEELIEELLALARNGDTVTDAEPVALATVADSAWRHVDTGSGTLAVDTESILLADGQRLEQLLENLFRNSVEHGTTSSRSGGNDVTVTVGTFSGGFFVEDDGSGLDPDSRETVFESGYSTNENGTGFGLAIVKRVADAHGWEVAATESSTGGARFEVTGVQFLESATALS